MQEKMGDYKVLAHVEAPECSLRILALKATQFVAPHYHNESTQFYTVLEHQAEARVGDRTLPLRPYETVRIDKGVVHSIRALDESALVLSLSVPPVSPADQHVVE